MKKSVKKSNKFIPKLKKGELGEFGYSHIKTMTTKQRRDALKGAMNKYGELSIFRKLNALYVLNKNKGLSPSEKREGKVSSISKILKTDRNWIGKCCLKGSQKKHKHSRKYKKSGLSKRKSKKSKRKSKKSKRKSKKLKKSI